MLMAARDIYYVCTRLSKGYNWVCFNDLDRGG